MAGKSSSAAFPGTVEMTMPFGGHISAFDLKRSGIPLFWDPYYDTMGGFDHINLKHSGDANSTAMGLRGVINSGKTGLIQTHGLRNRTRNMDGRRFRFAYDDHRTRKGEPEAQKLCMICATDEIKVRDYRLNLLDMGLGFEFGEQLDLVMEVLLSLIKRPYSIHESAALRYGLKKVRKDFPKTAEMGLYWMALKSLDHDEIVAMRHEFMNELANRHGHDPKFRAMAKKLRAAEELPEKLIVGTLTNGVYRPSGTTTESQLRNANERQLREIMNLDTAKVIEAAQVMALAIEILVDGPFGRLLGGEHSLADVLQRPAVVFDYSGLSGESMMLIQSLLWRIKAAAIARDDHRFFCDAEYHDENPSLWRYLVYARSMSLYMKRLRSTSVFLVLATHRRQDYATVGNVDSEQYSLAMNMERDINIWALGAMGREEALEAQAYHQLSDPQTRLLTDWRRQGMVGNWLLSLGAGKTFPTRTKLTPLELEITASNAANDAYVVDDPYGFDFWEEGDTPWLSAADQKLLLPV